MMRTKIQSLSIVLFIAVTLLATNQANSQYSQFQTQTSDEVKVSARYHLQTGTDQGFLIVKLDIPQDSYIYSMTQTEPLKPSKLVIKPTKQFVVGKQFKSDKQPKVIERDPVFQARLEKHSGTVQFYVPIRLATVTNPKSIQPQITFSGQVCSDQGYCVPIHGITVKAKFAGFFEREAKNSVPPLVQKK